MNTRVWNVRCLVTVALAAACLAGNCEMMTPSSNGGGNTTNDGHTLFVVNNQTGITSYANPAAAAGDVAPNTDLPAGSATQIFQPRGVVVTNSHVLIVSRQNGGLAVHDNALTATGSTSADRIVDGTATHLAAPISLAYAAASDTLYVGNINADRGILAFNNASADGFNGNIAPARMFSPPDRAPTTTLEMTVDAMCYDASGTLFVSDTSGLNVNSSRILVFDNASSASGETTPARTMTGNWGGIEDLARDAAGNLFVVDSSANIFRFNNAAALDGAVTPDATIMINGSGVDLQGIVVDPAGRGFAADLGNHEILILSGIASLNGAADAQARIAGNATELRNPRQLWIVAM